MRLNHSCWFIDYNNCLYKSICFWVNFDGKTIFTLAFKFPYPPVFFGKPRFLSLSILPDEVIAGIWIEISMRLGGFLESSGPYERQGSVFETMHEEWNSGIRTGDDCCVHSVSGIEKKRCRVSI